MSGPVQMQSPMKLGLGLAEHALDALVLFAGSGDRQRVQVGEAAVEQGEHECRVRGIEQLLLDMHEDQEFARGIMDAVTEAVLAPWILYQKRCFPGATRISGADATASPPIVNLPVLRDWVIPSIQRLRERCGPEVYVANWAGERYLPHPAEMLELKLAVGPGALWGQDPDVENLGPNVFKEFAVAHHVPVILGVGAAFLARATPGEVEARVREYVEVGGRGGHFALYLCNVGATTPPANLRAAVETAHAVRPRP